MVQISDPKDGVDASIYGNSALVRMGSIEWEMMGTMRLWALVMATAVFDLQRTANRTIKTPNGRQHNADNVRCRNDAHNWFFGYRQDYVGSLSYICEIFNLDIRAVRWHAKRLYREACANTGKRRRISLSRAIEKCDEILAKSRLEAQDEHEEVAA